MDTVKIISRSRSELGEGIVYEEKSQALYWVDIDGEGIYRKKADREDFFDLGEKVSCLRPASDNRWIIAAKSGIYLYDFASKEKELVANPEKRSDYRYNDGTCDSKGRFLIGTYGMKDQQKGAALYSIERGSCRVLLEGVTNSNGICLSADERFLYYIDTPEDKVFRFRYDIETGDISCREVWIDFTDEEGFPDGMAIDEEGNLYIAHFAGRKVSVWGSGDKEKKREYIFPASNITCPFIGRAPNDNLYAASAKKEDEEESGKVFMIEGNYRGMKLQSYKI